MNNDQYGFENGQLVATTDFDYGALDCGDLDSVESAIREANKKRDEKLGHARGRGNVPANPLPSRPRTWKGRSDTNDEVNATATENSAVA